MAGRIDIVPRDDTVSGKRIDNFLPHAIAAGVIPSASIYEFRPLSFTRVLAANGLSCDWFCSRVPISDHGKCISTVG